MLLVGLVQQLNHVLDLHIEAAGLDPGAKLQHAAHVGGGDDVGPGTGDVVHFAFENLHREVVLQDVVGAGAAATEVSVGHLDELESQGFEELPGRGTDLLAMREVAGVLVSDAGGNFFAWRAQAEVSEKFGDIFGLFGEEL